MKFRSGVSDEVVRRDDPAARAHALTLMPSERVIELLGSDEWALLIEALAMGDREDAEALDRPRVVGLREDTAGERESPITIPPGAGGG